MPRSKLSSTAHTSLCQEPLPKRPREESTVQPWTTDEAAVFHRNILTIGPEFHELARRIGTKCHNQVRYFFHRIVRKSKSDLQSKGITIDVTSKSHLRTIIDHYFNHLHSNKYPRRDARTTKLQHNDEKTSAKLSVQDIQSQFVSHLRPSELASKDASSSCQGPRAESPPDAYALEISGVTNAPTTKPLTPPIFSNDDVFYSTDIFGSSNNDIVDSSPSYQSWSLGASPITMLDEALGYEVSSPSCEPVESHLAEPSNCNRKFDSFYADDNGPKENELITDMALNSLQHAYTASRSDNYAKEMLPKPSNQYTLQLLPLCDAVASVMQAYGYNPKLQLKMSPSKQVSSVLKHLRKKWSKLFEEDERLSQTIKLCFFLGEDTISVFENVSLGSISNQLYNGDAVVILSYMWDMSPCQVDYVYQVHNSHCTNQDAYVATVAATHEGAVLQNEQKEFHPLSQQTAATPFPEETDPVLPVFSSESFDGLHDWSNPSSFFLL